MEVEIFIIFECHIVYCIIWLVYRQDIVLQTIKLKYELQEICFFNTLKQKQLQKFLGKLHQYH